MKKVASLVSLIFHPVIFFIIMPFFVVYRQTGNLLYALKWEVFSSIFVFLGLELFLLEMRKGLLTDFDLSKRKERPLFYGTVLFIAFTYLLISVFFKGIFFPLSIVVMGIILGIVLFEVLNYFLKVSVHMGITSSWVTVVSLMYGVPALLLVIWVIPLVAWARIFLKRHTFIEVCAGIFLGFFVTIVTFLVGKRLY